MGGREGKRKEGELPGCQHPAQVFFQSKESGSQKGDFRRLGGLLSSTPLSIVVVIMVVFVCFVFVSDSPCLDHIFG